MNRVLEPSEPAFRNGMPSRRLQAQEENTSVGRRMVHSLHFLLVIQLLAVHSSWALQSAPGRYSCLDPSGAKNLSGAQPTCTCCLPVCAPHQLCSMPCHALAATLAFNALLCIH